MISLLALIILGVIGTVMGLFGLLRNRAKVINGFPSRKKVTDASIRKFVKERKWGIALLAIFGVSSIAIGIASNLNLTRPTGPSMPGQEYNLPLNLEASGNNANLTRTGYAVTLSQYGAAALFNPTSRGTTSVWGLSVNQMRFVYYGVEDQWHETSFQLNELGWRWIANVEYTRYSITWTIREPGTSTNRTYYVYCEETLIGNDTWESGHLVSVDITGFIHETCSVFMIAKNDAGSAIDEVRVKFVKTTHIIIKPPDITYYENVRGNFIQWRVIDYVVVHPRYSIYKDGGIVATGTWNPSQIISINVDGLAANSYTYKIKASDDLGGTVEDEVLVTVLQNLSPDIIDSGNITYGVGTSGHAIMWTVIDESVTATRYWIYQGDEAIASGTWISGSTITQLVNGLDTGVHDFTLVVDDGTGLLQQDKVLVSVINSTNFAPVVTVLDSNLNIIEGQEFRLVIMVRDILARNQKFTIYLNGVEIKLDDKDYNFYEPMELGYVRPIRSNSWESGLKIAITHVINEAGTYELVMVFTDGYGGTTVSRHHIVVSIRPERIIGIILLASVISIVGFVGVVTTLFVVRPRETRAFFNKIGNTFKRVKKASRKPPKPAKIAVNKLEPETKDSPEPIRKINKIE